MNIDEEMGVAAVAGIGATPKGMDPASAEAKKFAEPGVSLKRDPRMKKKPVSRIMGFKSWTKNQ